MTADQRYLIWKSCAEHSEAWQAEQRRIADEANRKRAAAKVGNDNAAKMREPKTIVPQVVGSLNSTKRNITNEAKAAASKAMQGIAYAPKGEARKPEQVVVPVVQLPDPKPAPKRAVTREAKAAASKTNTGTVAKMDQLANNRPDLAEKVKVGEQSAGSFKIAPFVRFFGCRISEKVLRPFVNRANAGLARLGNLLLRRAGEPHGKARHGKYPRKSLTKLPMLS